MLNRAFLFIASMLVADMLFATRASAHPGHGVSGSGFNLAHHLTEPLHVFMIVGTLALLGALTWGLARRHRLEARRIR